MKMPSEFLVSQKTSLCAPVTTPTETSDLLGVLYSVRIAPQTCTVRNLDVTGGEEVRPFTAGLLINSAIN